jgi:hypothetical protein
MRRSIKSTVFIFEIVFAVKLFKKFTLMQHWVRFLSFIYFPFNQN